MLYPAFSPHTTLISWSNLDPLRVPGRDDARITDRMAVVPLARARFGPRVSNVAHARP